MEVSYRGRAASGTVVYPPGTDGVRAVRVDGAGRLHMPWHARPGRVILRRGSR